MILILYKETKSSKRLGNLIRATEGKQGQGHGSPPPSRHPSLSGASPSEASFAQRVYNPPLYMESYHHTNSTGHTQANHLTCFLYSMAPGTCAKWFPWCSSKQSDLFRLGKKSIGSAGFTEMASYIKRFHGWGEGLLRVMWPYATYTFSQWSYKLSLTKSATCCFRNALSYIWPKHLHTGMRLWENKPGQHWLSRRASRSL